jgi:hypothetical protein
MTNIEQRALELQQARNTKYGTDRIEWEPATKDNVNPIAQETPMTDKWHEQSMERHRQRWGLKGDSLECAGILGMRLKAREESLADMTIENDRQRSAGFKLATAKIQYQNREVRLWVEVSK